MRILRTAIAQINSTVGDIEGNTLKILDYINKARQSEAHVVIFPELAVTGYPPEDLLLKPRFLDQNMKALDRIMAHSEGIIVIVGFVDRRNDIFNSAAIMTDKAVVDIYHKQRLPNYGVFDENRYFQAGVVSPVYMVDNIAFGVNICEDIWYAGGPARTQALAGAEVIININASPYHFGKTCLRQQLLLARAVDNRLIVIYANMVGGQDELVFDGASFIVNEEGDVIARAPQFQEALLVADLNIESVIRARLRDPRHRQEARSYKDNVKSITIPFKISERNTLQPTTDIHTMADSMEEVYQALMLGTHDYVRKNGFKQVAIGLSGGVDSAMVAAIASDALGAQNVTGVFMPSPFTSQESRDDVEALRQNLGIKVIEISITEIFKIYKAMLKEPFTGYGEDITEENLQARIRGNLLMALSNKFGWLVLTTGNKSEMSVGYATLYGDMAGGFAV
ncbi:MAG TPA: NAD+ synthase, partial [Thermodesulfovibrionia bacterium]|nr:NAD+ synthase [Thermodesulfovibrionia bacterium]